MNKLILTAMMALSVTLAAHADGNKQANKPCDMKEGCCAKMEKQAKTDCCTMQSMKSAGDSQVDRDLVREQRQTVYTGKNPIRDLAKPEASPK